MRKAILILMVLGAVGSLRAQQASPGPSASPASLPPLPPGPLLKPVADNTRWTLTITRPAAETPQPADSPPPGDGTGPAKSPGPASKAKVTVMGERMGKLAHVLSVSANGDKEEKWTDGFLTATSSPKSKEPFYATTRIEGMPVPTWISPKNYVDAKTEGEKHFLIFRDLVVPSEVEIIQDLEHPGQTNTEKLKVETTAVIDADTHLPVAVKVGEATTVYKYEPLAAGTEIIPSAILKTLTDRGKKYRDTIRTPVRP